MRINKILKTISLILIHSFVLEQLAFAAPDLKPIEWNSSPKLKLNFQFPASVATIEDSWQAEPIRHQSVGGLQQVYLLQDAHTNPSGQLNVANTLNTLFKNDKDLNYVFLEAGSGDESITSLRNRAPLEHRKEVAKAYLMKGMLQGSEYASLTMDPDFRLYGVEDMNLYLKSLETYRFIASHREKYENYLDRVESTIKTLKRRIYNPLLLGFDQKYQKFKKNELSLSDYYEALLVQAKLHSISLSSYPHLQSLSQLRALEKAIDFQKASQEEAQAIAALSAKDQAELKDASKENSSPFKLGGEDNKAGSGFFILLEEKLAEGAKPIRFPSLTQYFHYLKEAKKIHAPSVLQEQNFLEREIFTSLSMSEDETTLIQASKNLESLKDLLHLKLTPDQYEEYRKDQANFNGSTSLTTSIERITGFLNKKIMELKSDYERVVFLESGYQDVIQKCEEFYELTYKRDEHFIQEMLRKTESGQSAVLITGGYHSPNLKYLLKKQNISYIVIAPQITQETNQARYEKLLLSQNLKNPLQNPSIQNITKSNPLTNSLMAARLSSRFDPWGDQNEFLARLSGGMAPSASRLAEGEVYSISYPVLNSQTRLPRIESAETSLNNFLRAANNSISTAGWIFMIMIPWVFATGYRKLLEKSSSWVRNIREFSTENFKSRPFLRPLGPVMTSIPSALSGRINLKLTSSSASIRSSEKSGKDGVFPVLQDLSRKMKSRLDVLLGEAWVSFKHFFRSLAGLQKLEHDIEGDTGPTETNLSMLYFLVGRNIFLDFFITHLVPLNPFKYTMTGFIDQKTGIEIVTASRLATNEDAKKAAVLESNLALNGQPIRVRKEWGSLALRIDQLVANLGLEVQKVKSVRLRVGQTVAPRTVSYLSHQEPGAESPATFGTSRVDLSNQKIEIEASGNNLADFTAFLSQNALRAFAERDGSETRIVVLSQTGQKFSEEQSTALFQLKHFGLDSDGQNPSGTQAYFIDRTDAIQESLLVPSFSASRLAVPSRTAYEKVIGSPHSPELIQLYEQLVSIDTKDAIHRAGLQGNPHGHRGHGVRLAQGQINLSERILIIEDRRGRAVFFRRLLEDYSYTFVGHAGELYHLLKSSPEFDVILLGTEIVGVKSKVHAKLHEWLRTMYPKARIIVWGHDEDEKKRLPENVDFVLVKEPRRVVQTITEILPPIHSKFAEEVLALPAEVKLAHSHDISEVIAILRTLKYDPNVAGIIAALDQAVLQWSYIDNLDQKKGELAGMPMEKTKSVRLNQLSYYENLQRFLKQARQLEMALGPIVDMADEDRIKMHRYITQGLAMVLLKKANILTRYSRDYSLSTQQSFREAAALFEEADSIHHKLRLVEHQVACYVGLSRCMANQASQAFQEAKMIGGDLAILSLEKIPNSELIQRRFGDFQAVLRVVLELRRQEKAALENVLYLARKMGPEVEAMKEKFAAASAVRILVDGVYEGSIAEEEVVKKSLRFVEDSIGSVERVLRIPSDQLYSLSQAFQQASPPEANGADDTQASRLGSMIPITEIAEKAGLRRDEIEVIETANAAKIKFDKVNRRLQDAPDGKVILVTAINPTKAGEGKTTTAIGLVQGFGYIGENATVVLREPSLGPFTGAKGGATGKGKATLEPSQEINWQFTGDIPAVEWATNKLAAMMDNHIRRGNTLGIDLERITWPRSVDISDSALRSAALQVEGVGKAKISFDRKTRWVITAASEVMAILALARNLKDLRHRLGRIIVAYTKDGKPVTAEDLKSAGVMAVALRHAIKPNLVQTQEGQAAFIHAGPFANVAHGNSSVIALNTARKLTDYVVTEAGFGADLGAEKFFDIVARQEGITPSLTVLVVTVQALQLNGGLSEKEIKQGVGPERSLEALRNGFKNLDRHVSNLKKFGVPILIAINRFPKDSEDELRLIKQHAEELHVRAELSEGVTLGGAGASDLANAAKEIIAGEHNHFNYLYDLNIPIKEKIEKLAGYYGADGVDFEPRAEEDIRRLEEAQAAWYFKALGFDVNRLPVNVAKTQYSFTHDVKLLGAPTGWKLKVSSVQVSAGAGFLVVECAGINLLPGLAEHPAAEFMDIEQETSGARLAEVQVTMVNDSQLRIGEKTINFNPFMVSQIVTKLKDWQLNKLISNGISFVPSTEGVKPNLKSVILINDGKTGETLMKIYKDTLLVVVREFLNQHLSPLPTAPTVVSLLTPPETVPGIEAPKAPIVVTLVKPVIVANAASKPAAPVAVMDEKILAIFNEPYRLSHPANTNFEMFEEAGRRFNIEPRTIEGTDYRIIALNGVADFRQDDFIGFVLFPQNRFLVFQYQKKNFMRFGANTMVNAEGQLSEIDYTAASLVGLAQEKSTKNLVFVVSQDFLTKHSSYLAAFGKAHVPVHFASAKQIATKPDAYEILWPADRTGPAARLARTKTQQPPIPGIFPSSELEQTLSPEEITDLARYVLEVLASDQSEALGKEQALDLGIYRISSEEGRVYFSKRDGPIILTIEGPKKVLQSIRLQNSGVTGVQALRQSVVSLFKYDRLQAQNALSSKLTVETGFILPQYLDKLSDQDFYSALETLISQMTEFRSSESKISFFLGLNENDPRRAVAKELIGGHNFIKLGRPTAMDKGILIHFENTDEEIIDINDEQITNRTLRVPVSGIDPSAIQGWARLFVLGKATAALGQTYFVETNQRINFQNLRQTKIKLLDFIMGFWNSHLSGGSIPDSGTLMKVITGIADPAVMRTYAFKLPTLQKIPIGARVAFANAMYRALGRAA